MGGKLWLAFSMLKLMFELMVIWSVMPLCCITMSLIIQRVAFMIALTYCDDTASWLVSCQAWHIGPDVMGFVLIPSTT